MILDGVFRGKRGRIVRFLMGDLVWNPSYARHRLALKAGREAFGSSGNELK